MPFHFSDSGYFQSLPFDSRILTCSWCFLIQGGVRHTMSGVCYILFPVHSPLEYSFMHSRDEYAGLRSLFLHILVYRIYNLSCDNLSYGFFFPLPFEDMRRNLNLEKCGHDTVRTWELSLLDQEIFPTEFLIMDWGLAMNVLKWLLRFTDVTYKANVIKTKIPISCSCEN